jgi:hypothetical protein
MAQDAHSPNKRLIGSVMANVKRVSFIAETISGIHVADQKI